MKTHPTQDRRVVLITGASSGFGHACSAHLSRKGHRVYGTSRSASFEQEAKNRPFILIPMDVRDQAPIDAGVAYILKHESRIDAVVNNSGFGIAGSVEDTAIEEICAQFETNFFGVLRVCRAVLPQMRKQGSGHIVNISSLAGLMGVPFQGAYSASKFAIEGLTEALRMEVKPFGIQVALIEPGDFKTGFTKNRVITAGAQQSPVYSEKFQKALVVMEAEEQNGPTPDKLAFLVEKVLSNPAPRLRYTAGGMVQRFAAVFKRLAPAFLLERAIMITYRIN
jgi:NAD(P)-dependent dehydrogenase (short-subunit alcohol dehydrogenase family)